MRQYIKEFLVCKPGKLSSVADRMTYFLLNEIAVNSVNKNYSF